MGSSGLARFPGIDTNRDRNQYLQQCEYALHEDRLSVAGVTKYSTMAEHQTIRPQTFTDVPELKVKRD